MTRVKFFCVFILSFFLSSITSAQQINNEVANAAIRGSDQSYSENKRYKANRGTVSIVTYFHGAYSRMGADLANVLDLKMVCVCLRLWERGLSKILKMCFT